MKDVLAAFSPGSEFLAIATTDGRIKNWDVINGWLRGEFVDGAVSTSGAGVGADTGNGHLAVDYSCLTWVPSGKKARKKGNTFLLVLGTAAGDILAWDVSLGQLKWRTNDCCPGGVKAVARSKSGNVVYAAGADGMIYEVDSGNGQILEKFRAAKTAVSRIAVSPGGDVLLTASSELKTFDLSSRKRIRKFSGHPGEVTALAFSRDGKFALSSSLVERQVSVWNCDTNSTDCGAVFSLSCDQSVVFLDGSGFQQDTQTPLKVLAISETGAAYVWQSNTIEELASVKPTTITVAKNTGKKGDRSILAAFLTRKTKDVTTVKVAHGTSARPTFEEISVSAMGTTIVLGSEQAGGVFLPPQPAEAVPTKKTNVTVLGPDNAADAVMSKTRVESGDIALSKPANNARKRAASVESDDDEDGTLEQRAEWAEEDGTMEEDDDTPLEERLVSLGIVDKEATDEEKDVKVIPPRRDSLHVLLSQGLQSDDNSLLERCLSVQDEKIIKNTVGKLRPSEAGKFLNACTFRLETRPRRGLALVSWIRAILMQHSTSLMTNPAMQPVLTTLYQLIDARMVVFRPLLALSGRLDLITTHILGQQATTVEEEEELIEAVIYEEGDSEVEVDQVEPGQEEESSSDSDKEMSDVNETMVSDSEVEEEDEEDEDAEEDQ
ncbi:hypothetical protein R1sor_021394 [Riccia sorocarpa]|uniref:Small-subunit processome Utp12 domain-containing protein n=1 Tax=Riccia sorocarpa TaxID=122646 RepID=A0ABD3GH00_9MARC